MCASGLIGSSRRNKRPSVSTINLDSWKRTTMHPTTPEALPSFFLQNSLGRLLRGPLYSIVQRIKSTGLGTKFCVNEHGTLNSAKHFKREQNTLLVYVICE
jgi:hypothetical protein